MHNSDEIRQLLLPWGELRPQNRGQWQGKPHALPQEIADFYAQIGPWGEVIYESVGPTGISLCVGGNPVCIPPLARLHDLQAGYAWQASVDESLEDWPEHWLVIAEQGGDPFIYDRLSAQVLFAFHGAGRWEPKVFAPDLHTAIGALATVANVHESLSEQELNLDDGLTPQGRLRVLDALSRFTGDKVLATAMLSAWEYYE